MALDDRETSWSQRKSGDSGGRISSVAPPVASVVLLVTSKTFWRLQQPVVSSIIGEVTPTVVLARTESEYFMRSNKKSFVVNEGKGRPDRRAMKSTASTAEVR